VLSGNPARLLGVLDVPVKDGVRIHGPQSALSL
jgi:hypothetical protein